MVYTVQTQLRSILFAFFSFDTVHTYPRANERDKEGWGKMDDDKMEENEYQKSLDDSGTHRSNAMRSRTQQARKTKNKDLDLDRLASR